MERGDTRQVHFAELMRGFAKGSTCPTRLSMIIWVEFDRRWKCAPSPACGGGRGGGVSAKRAGREDRLAPTRRALSSAIAEAQLRRSILDGRRWRPLLPRKRER